MAAEDDGDVAMTDATDGSEATGAGAAASDIAVGSPSSSSAAAGGEAEEGAAPPAEGAGDEPPAEAGPPPEERVARAEAAKEEGNALLKAGDAAGALAKYRDGFELTEPLLEKDPGELGEDLQMRGTVAYQALRLNSAQACLKTGEWAAAIEHADRVLLLDKDNTKALYRRGLASMALDTEGRVDAARLDFARVAALDPSNREVRGQLAKAKDRLKDLKEEGKKRLSMAMSGGLYQEQHAKLGKQQAAYEAEVQRRAEAGEDEISFEDWLKKEKEKEEEIKKKRKEEQEKQQKEEQERLQQEAFAQEVDRRKEAGEEDISFEAWVELEKQREQGVLRERIGGVLRTDEADLDAEERRLLQETKSKGYYHGRLGTVLSDAAPKPQQVQATDASPHSENGKHVGSEWNQAGTWEEKDMTSWVKERLSAWLQQAEVGGSQVQMPSGKTADVSARITKVKSLTGDAQLVTVRKKPKHGYNFEADLSFSLAFKQGEEACAEGEEAPAAAEKFHGGLTLPELSDFVQPGDLRVDARWKGIAPSSELTPLAREWVDKLRESVRCQVSGFKAEYQQKK